MAKEIIKRELVGQCKAKDGQPIHLHVPGDIPIYLHISNEERKPIISTGLTKCKSVPSSCYQAPWIPPPAKTSLAHTSTESKRLQKHAVAKAARERLSDKEEIPVCSQSASDKPEIEVGEALYQHKERLGDTSRFVHPKPYETKESDTTWAKNVVDNWIKDLDNSLSHITKSVRNINDCLEEMSFEGRMNCHDIQQLTRPRDELILHAEVAGRVGRELCRWAGNLKYQEDKILARKLTQSCDREAALCAEIQQLTERLNTLTTDLQVAKDQLNEQQSESQKFSTMQESLETVKGHLQRQLRQRDSECSRLSTQLNNMESRLIEQKSSSAAHLEMANNKLEKMREIKEALKRAARAQKCRADEYEKEFDDVSRRLREKDDMIAFLQTELTKQSQSRNLDYLLSEEAGGNGRYATESRLKEENARLNTMSRSYEQRLKVAERELEQLRSNLSTCEALLDNYHGDAATHTNRLHVLSDRLKKTEEDREHDQAQLKDLERRLHEAETRNDILETALHSHKTDAAGKDYRPHDSSDFKATQQADLLRRSGETIGDHESADELRRQLSQAQYEREQIERCAEIRLTDLRAQLNQADATNRSLQAYLTFLKRSYAGVFQPDILSLMEPSPTNQQAAMKTDKMPVPPMVTGCSN